MTGAPNRQRAGRGSPAGTLPWRPVPGVPWARWCELDGGTITEHRRGGPVTVRLVQDDGAVRALVLPDVRTAWEELRLSRDAPDGMARCRIA